MNDSAVKNNRQQVQTVASDQKIQSQKTTDKSVVQNKTDSDLPGNMSVTKRDIENVVSSWTGIPISKLTEDESAKLLGLEDRIHKRLIDQEEAVTKVSEAVRRGRIGLSSGQRPIASFIFLGPSGTGKTELAKTLAEILFGRDDAMVRLDMSEYMEKHEVAKLIGAPPGYVGYEEGGQLTEAVRAKPYSIVLLDEVEKAHPDVFNILLQLLEDGRLTDNKGNTISFRNTIVICTSNIGSSLITDRLGEQDTKIEKTAAQYTKQFTELSAVVNNELRKFFRPELLNRFDDVVIFKPLHRDVMVGIAKLGIEKTALLLKEQGFFVEITERALKKLALEGYDPMYGARPLRRLIQGSIENPVALQIIGKKYVHGDTIRIDYSNNTNEFIFTQGVPRIEPEKVEEQTTATPVQQPVQQVEPVPGQAVPPLAANQTAQPPVAQPLYYGQPLPNNQPIVNPQMPPVVPATNFDPLSVLGGDLQQPVNPLNPPSSGAYVTNGAQDTILNTGNYQQGVANEVMQESVLQGGQLTGSGIEELDE
jgi:ATP-dependent Clp protease ATP-binding subunit ClpA